jgi:thiamine-phosphate pyrophosphorylase
MIDANLNRICEGLRIIEDFLRFEINNNFIKSFVERLKTIRHFIREKISVDPLLIKYRDSIKDSGRKYHKIESNRSNANDLIKANFYRIEEGLRVLEELFKIENKAFISDIKNFRFEIYNMEKIILDYLSFNVEKIKNIVSIDITDVIFSDLQKIIKKIKPTAVELFSASLNNNIFFSISKKIKNICDKNNIILLINNRIDLAAALECSYATVDSSNFDPKLIKDKFKLFLGYHAKNEIELNYAYNKNIDFIIINEDSKINNILLNKYKDKIKIAKEVSEKFNNLNFKLYKLLVTTQPVT